MEMETAFSSKHILRIHYRSGLQLKSMICIWNEPRAGALV